MQINLSIAFYCLLCEFADVDNQEVAVAIYSNLRIWLSKRPSFSEVCE